MRALGQDFLVASSADPIEVRTKPTSQNHKSTRHQTTRDCPRVTLRFSPDDYETLKQLADGMTLATYIRAKALDNELPRRKHRSSAPIADKQALGQILGLLGQSRIANNLNQLAFHANVGSLVMDDETHTRILESYQHVLFLRKSLISALGLRE